MQINSQLKKAVVDEDSLKLTFANDCAINITDYHDQDCCENVGVDFDEINLVEFDRLKGRDIINMFIKKIPGSGFSLNFVIDEIDEIFGIFKEEMIIVTAHNIQNGHYSSDLTLIVQTQIDVSDCVKDFID